MFISNVLVKNSIEEFDKFFGNSLLIGTDRSCLPNYFYVFALHGVLPVNIS
jgi:hypothetical protein